MLSPAQVSNALMFGAAFLMFVGFVVVMGVKLFLGRENG